jgi:hypothetical protein
MEGVDLIDSNIRSVFLGFGKQNLVLFVIKRPTYMVFEEVRLWSLREGKKNP